ncbi:MAG: hypothetical protein UMU75_10410 [Halomonas sp.]|nr:hypothetical protein [Halomonas sp.]
MQGSNNNFNEHQLRELADQALTDELVDHLACQVCRAFLSTSRAVVRYQTGAAPGIRQARVGVSIGQSHRPGDYRHVRDFLNATAEGSVSEDGNPAHSRPCTVRDQLEIPQLLSAHVAARFHVGRKEIASLLASNPALFQWWCRLAEECEQHVGRLPMSELLFRYAAQARQALHASAAPMPAHEVPAPSVEGRRPGAAAYKMHENRINGLCRQVWHRFKDTALTLDNGEPFRQMLAAMKQEHGAKVVRTVVVRLRTQYDPTSQWCSRELWRETFDTYIPLDTGTQ